MKLFLIDGHALVFKMYYAFLGRPMVNTKGVDTSILFGFTKYLLELVARENPTHLAVSFDPPGGTFRNDLYPQYKANREATPQLVIDALEPLQRIVGALGVPVLMVKGFEADDVICSAAIKFRDMGFEVYMVTPDKDYGQVVSPGIFQYRPGKSGADAEILGPAEVCAKWGIDSAAKVVDVLSICGDTADNVPGVQGVGPVGAAKLLAKYGTLEGIYEHIGELTGKQQAMFKEAEDHIWLSRKLVTIKTDIPLDVTEERLRLDMRLSPDIAGLLDEYEMPSLKRLIPSAGPAENTAPAVAAAEVEVREVAAAELAGAESLAVVRKGDTIFLSDGTRSAAAFPADVAGILSDPAVQKCGGGMKDMLKYLQENCGIEAGGRILDIELMHYLLNPERSHKVDALARTYLGVELGHVDGVSAEATLFDGGAEPDGVVEDKAESLREAAVLALLSAKLRGELAASPALEKIYDTIEEPLLKVLARMEMAGVRIDPAALSEYAEGLRDRMIRKEAEVRELAGEKSLNVSSPKQIGELLFERMKLDPSAKKPRGGNWPTDEQTLSALSDRSPIIDAILEYRGLRKLLSTYIEPLPGYVSSRDGRVHTTFNQALTSTGRLSSSSPNLQNIPVRTEDGREIRRAFTAGESGSVIMSADYSQIELRVMAHFCADPHLVQAFRSGIDIHEATASRIFGVPAGEVTPEQRRKAKTANFGIMYGISAFGLSQRLGCSRSEASALIRDYFESFPSIRAYIDDTLAFARENGYVETLYGRRRYIPDINAHNAVVRSVAERNAVNAPIQGSAADIIKLAMIEVDRRLRKNGLRSRMVLQIHDELLLEVPENEIEEVRGLLVGAMEGIAGLSVPLTVECNYGKNWLDAH